MSSEKSEVYAYLLVDNGLLQESSAKYTEPSADSRPTWLEPIYEAKALEVSPLLIDIEAAYEGGSLDRMMELVNALKPAMHLSIIESALPLSELAQHLRRFIFIVAENGKQYTLRYADCAVLVPLSSVLSPSQWTTLTEPLLRWSAHDRANALIQMPPPIMEQTGAPTPLHFTDDQFTTLNEALEPDHFLAQVKQLRAGITFPGDACEQHAWASQAREAWRAAGNTNNLFLLSLTEAALLTRGEILRRRNLPSLLAIKELSSFRAKIRELAQEIEERRIRLLEMKTSSPETAQY
ncbi:DUF4123 domain-containing protein [Massilia horti]|uniref:DUF4123 domain-containing protein n=1 Tax=Massilia horti TaxID=2562153 RepID=A0A4Y9T2H3_9BURK|nr:DUF4123 domain-containing protein [Massilia horti]TFW33607.1 DUF4123 domain-containing protein [Massilia horti]